MNFVHFYNIGRMLRSLRTRKMAYSDLAPPTVQPCDAVVALDGFLALGAFSMAVSFYPVVRH
jgi:hypothetical protein